MTNFDINSTVGYLINRLSFLLRQDLQRRFRAVGQTLTAEEWALIGQLWAEDGLSRQQLANRTIKDETTVTRLLDAMVRKGLVRREQDTNDRRIVRIHLTDAGRQIEAVLVPQALALMADTTNGISADDLAITVRTLQRIQENLLRGAESSMPML